MLKKTPIPALLLSAGIGSRLAPLTNSIPKCLVPILGRPLLDFQLEKCVKAKMSPIIVNTSYLSKTVENFISNSQYKNMVIISHETKLLGTCGTILALEQYLSKDTFFVAHADLVGVDANKHLKIVGERLGKDTAYLLDATALKKKLQWADKITLEQGILEVVNWVKDNLADKLLDKAKAQNIIMTLGEAGILI